jgi:hypothetical protein
VVASELTPSAAIRSNVYGNAVKIVGLQQMLPKVKHIFVTIIIYLDGGDLRAEASEPADHRFATTRIFLSIPPPLQLDLPFVFLYQILQVDHSYNRQTQTTSPRAETSTVGIVAS